MHNIEVEYRIIGYEMRHEEITAVLGVQPSKITHKGDKVSPNSTIVYKENIWSLISNLDDNDSVGSHFEFLQAEIEPYIEKFREIGLSYYTEFSCCIYLDSDSDKSVPSIHLSNAISRFVAQLNSNIDIDIILL